MIVRGERLNGITHLVGTLLAIAGAVVIVAVAAKHHDPFRVGGCAVFGGSLVLLYFASTTYHCAWGRAKQVFQKLDHAAIYLLIAGTYTPYALVTLRGGWGWTLFGLIWALAVVGIAQELLRGGSRRASLAIYLVMGWLALIALRPLSSALGARGMAWLVSGGVTYTVGVLFYVLDGRMRYAHGIWHVFVLGGSSCHFFGILRAVA